jgi:tight adherence protein C
MDPALSEKSFAIIVAAATFVAFWALGMALTWQPPIEARLKALRTRRMKTRGEHTAAKTSPKAVSLGFLREIADRLNLLRGAAADQTSRKLRQAGFHSRDAAVVYVFIKLALPLLLGFLMIGLTSVTNVIAVPEDFVLATCVGAVLVGFLLPEIYIKNVASKRREVLNAILPEGLDLLTICVEAGLSIDAAFRRVSREMQGSMPELVNALRQTEKYGTPLAASLRILSQEFRQTRASKAEEKGARMPALMTVPLMVFILPTLITVLIAPAIMSMFAVK